MAKLNLELEVDWIDEEMSLDDAVKDGIMRRIEEKIISKISNSIEKNVEGKVTNQVDGLISTAIDNEIEKFLTTPRDITDKYGDINRTQVTIATLIKEKIDGMMEKKTVNERGNYTSSAYAAKYTKFEYFMESKAQEIINIKVDQMIKSVKEQIENLVSDKIKTNVADKLTEMIMENSTALKLKS